MIESPETTPDQNASLGLATGPGRQLRNLREQQGLEIDRVASQLHLRPEIVKALEEERYEDLPTPVFVIGYIKNYARLFDTDPTPIVRAYRQAVPASDPQSATIMPTSQMRRNSTGLWIRVLSVLLAIIAVGVLYLWWQERSNEDTRLTQDVSTQSSGPEQSGSYSETTSAPSGNLSAGAPTTASTSSASTQTAPEPSDNTATPRPQESVAAQPDATDNTAASASEPAAQPQPEEDEPADTREPMEIVMSFTGTSWVDVRSADNSIVLNGEMRSGDRQKLSGEPPYKMVIGNAAATRITIAGKPLDVAARAHGNVARFTLTADEISKLGGTAN